MVQSAESRPGLDLASGPPLREIEADLEQFAVNARRSPGRVLGNHAKNQGSNRFAHRLSTSHSPGSGHPCPVQPKAGTMPTSDGSRRNQDERVPPARPQLAQHDPEELVPRSESALRSFG